MTPKQILNLRTSLGLTQEEMAEKLGVCRRTMQGWEHGKHVPGRLAVNALKAMKKAADSKVL